MEVREHRNSLKETRCNAAVFVRVLITNSLAVDHTVRLLAFTKCLPVCHKLFVVCPLCAICFCTGLPDYFNLCFCHCVFKEWILLNCNFLLEHLLQEMQNMNMLQPQQNLPDAAELLTKWFGGGTGPKRKEIKNKPSKKQQ